MARLRDGAARLSSVAKCILPKALAGRTESEVAAEIEAAHPRGPGSSGPRLIPSSPPDRTRRCRTRGPASRRIEPGELVVVDFGGVLDGYCTDLTRTRGRRVGRDGGNGALIEQVVGGAACGVCRRSAPGAQPEAVDEAARERAGAARTGRGVHARHGPRAGTRSARRPARHAGAGWTAPSRRWRPAW